MKERRSDLGWDPIWCAGATSVSPILAVHLNHLHDPRHRQRHRSAQFLLLRPNILVWRHRYFCPWYARSVGMQSRKRRGGVYEAIELPTYTWQTINLRGLQLFSTSLNAKPPIVPFVFLLHMSNSSS
jgi:hypothetical protein